MSYIHKAKIMYANEDIYSGPNDPSTNINPKIIGAFYINTKTAKLFVCTDNTNNRNVWKICNPDIKMPEIPKPDGLGYNQKYKELKNKYNIWYTNNSVRPIYVICFPYIQSGRATHFIDVRDTLGDVVSIGFNQNDTYDNFIMSCVVPPYFSYMVRTNLYNTDIWVLS
jgi:hypothetical protein